MKQTLREGDAASLNLYSVGYVPIGPQDDGQD